MRARVYTTKYRVRLSLFIKGPEKAPLSFPGARLFSIVSLLFRLEGDRLFRQQRVLSDGEMSAIKSVGVCCVGSAVIDFCWNPPAQIYICCQQSDFLKLDLLLESPATK